jgi:hypothetical protein
VNFSHILKFGILGCDTVASYSERRSAGLCSTGSPRLSAWLARQSRNIVMPGLGTGELLVPSSELHLCFMPQALVVMFVSFCITRQVQFSLIDLQACVGWRSEIIEQMSSGAFFISLHYEDSNVEDVCTIEVICKQTNKFHSSYLLYRVAWQSRYSTDLGEFCNIFFYDN